MKISNDVAGSLKEYAKGYIPSREIRESAIMREMREAVHVMDTIIDAIKDKNINKATQMIATVDDVHEKAGKFGVYRYF